MKPTVEQYKKNLGKLSKQALIDKYGEEGYSELQRKKAKKSKKIKQEMMKDGRLVLLDGKWRKPI